MTIAKKKNHKKLYITLLIIFALLLWRFSYFVFVPDISGAMNIIHKTDVTAKIAANLKVATDTIEDQSTIWQYGVPNPYQEKQQNIKVELSLDIFKLADVITFTSKEFDWKREFNDYYGEGGIVASSDKYLVILLRRNPKCNFDKYFNVMSGYSGPPPSIYFLYNTSKIGYKDIYLLDRENGKTIKHFRFDSILYRAYYNKADNSFYFRFSDKETYRRLNISQN